MKTLLLSLAILSLLYAPHAKAQRLVTSALTLADLRAIPLPNQNSTNVLVAGRRVPGDGFEGPFTWLNGDTTLTNLGTVFASTHPSAPAGRWHRQYTGSLNAQWFDAPGNGTDQTIGVKNAYDTIDKTAGGDIYFPPGNYAFNLEVTNRNIGLIFDSFIKEDSGIPTAIKSNIVTAANVALPIVTIGNGTDSAKGSRITGGTFTGNGSSGVLLRLAGGAYECIIDSAQFYGAQTNIWVQAHGTQPASINYFNKISCQAANVDDSRGFFVATPDTGVTFTTVTTFNGSHFNSQAGAANARLGEIDGTDVTFTSVNLGVISNAPVRFSRSASSGFVVDPIINNANVIWDGSSTFPAIEDNYGASKRISAFLQGSYSFNGQALMQDGTILTQEVCQSPTTPSGHLFNDYIRGPLKFMSVEGGTTNRTWARAEVDDADQTIFRLISTNGTLELSGQTNISLGTGPFDIATNRMLYVQPGMVSITNAWTDTTALKVYGAGSGAYSDTNTPTVRFFTAGVSNEVRSALHLDSYQNTPAFPISLDFGLMNSTNAEATSRIVHYANVNTNRETELQLHSHNITNGVWNTNITMNSTGVGISAFGRLVPAFPLDVDGSAQIRGDQLNVRGVPMLWPAANGAGSLTNDGAGNLSWGLVTGGGGGATNAYNLVQDEGVPLTQRDTINLVGAGVSAADSGGVTTITIPGGQPVFTTAVGVTNISNVLSGNYSPGSNVTFTTNANGNVSIASTGGGASDNWAASGTTNSTLPGIATLYGIGPITNLTASLPVKTDASKNLSSGQIIEADIATRAVTDTKIEYAVAGVTSAGGTLTFNFDGARRQTNGESGALTVAFSNKPTTAVDRLLTTQFYPTTNTLTLTWPTTVGGSAVRWIGTPRTSISTNTYVEVAYGWNGLEVVLVDMSDTAGSGLAFEVAGSGSDFTYSTTSAYEKIIFGTTGPSFTLTNAGQYQVIVNLSALDSSVATTSQEFFVTNITDGVVVPSSHHTIFTGVTSSGANSVVIPFQLTTAAANKSFEIWGQTINGSAANASVIATNTTVDVVLLSASASSGTPTTGGYWMELQGPSFNPSNGDVNYYIGASINGNASDLTLYTNNAMRILRGGTIKKAWLRTRITTTLGSTENVAYYLRLNNATDITLTATATLSAAINEYAVDLNQALVEGDYLAIKQDSPATWATSPTSVGISCRLFIDF